MTGTIKDYVPAGTETGVGLALRDSRGRYLFFLAGTRHQCPPGELFYAGIGGHLEDDEDWLACARREAWEEIGATVEILPSPTTWYIPRHGPIQEVRVTDRPRPLAIYEMEHPSGTPRAGETYRIVIYTARLCDLPKSILPDEIQGVVALTEEQVIQGIERKPTLNEIVSERGAVIAGCESVDPEVRLYPIGTARALAHILRYLNRGIDC